MNFAARSCGTVIKKRWWLQFKQLLRILPRERRTLSSKRVSWNRGQKIQRHPYNSTKNTVYIYLHMAEMPLPQMFWQVRSKLSIAGVEWWRRKTQQTSGLKLPIRISTLYLKNHVYCIVMFISTHAFYDTKSVFTSVFIIP